MGEYAQYRGEQVKIGTCEDMYYLRYDQRASVGPPFNSTNPITEAADIRFRFPFPDEDHISPGQFDNADRGVEIPGYDPPEWIAKEGGTGPVEVIQQRLVIVGEISRELWTVVRAKKPGTLLGLSFRLPVEEAERAAKCLHMAARQLEVVDSATPCQQCGVIYGRHGSGDGVESCPGDFGPDDKGAAFLDEIGRRITKGYVIQMYEDLDVLAQAAMTPEPPEAA